MLKLKPFLPKTWWSSVLWIVLTYVFFADVLPNVLLLVINCSGYLPYSDRPGPGWQAPHWPGSQELGFFFGFALYMGVPTLLYAAAQAVLGIIYGICSLPKWAIRVCGGVSAFLAAGLLMEGAGWMIAMAPIGVYLAAGCGFLWGTLLLPELVVRMTVVRPLAARIALPLIVVGCGVAYLIYPLLPKTPLPSITFEMNRVTPGSSFVQAAATPYLKAETQREIDALQLHGDEHGGIQSSQGTGSDQSVDVVVLTLEPIRREYKLDVPAFGHVVYVLEKGKLTAHPSIQKKARESILIDPGVDPVLDGGRIKVGDMPQFANFTWYPTIKK